MKLDMKTGLIVAALVGALAVSACHKKTDTDNAATTAAPDNSATTTPAPAATPDSNMAAPANNAAAPTNSAAPAGNTTQ